MIRDPEAPPAMEGVTWLKLHCPTCDGPWWQGVDDDSCSCSGPLLDPLSRTGLTTHGEDLVASFTALLGECSDCRDGRR